MTPEPSDSGSGSATLQEAVKVLQQRPDYDTAAKNYAETLARVRTTLTDAGLVTTWKQTHDAGSGACTEWGDEGANLLNADGLFSASWRTDPITDEDWPRASQAITKVIAEQGFTRVEPVVDKPGDHNLFVFDSYGSRFYLGTARSTVMSIQGACFLLPGKPPLLDPNEPLSTDVPTFAPRPEPTPT